MSVLKIPAEDDDNITWSTAEKFCNYAWEKIFITFAYFLSVHFGIFRPINILSNILSFLVIYPPRQYAKYTKFKFHCPSLPALMEK